MRLAALAVSFALALGAGGCCGTGGVQGADDDVRLLAAELERIHPDPYHATPRAELAAAADALAGRAEELSRDELLVELMRLTALLGERDGHSGLWPLDPGHGEPFHLLPVRLYDFADGLHVVAQVGGDDLVGSRVVAIAGRPVEEVARLVEPLVPHDNAWSLRARVPHWVTVAEVLRGLGVAGDGAIELGVERGGSARTVTLEPAPGPRYQAALRAGELSYAPDGLPGARLDAFS